MYRQQLLPETKSARYWTSPHSCCKTTTLGQVGMRCNAVLQEQLLCISIHNTWQCCPSCWCEELTPSFAWTAGCSDAAQMLAGHCHELTGPGEALHTWPAATCGEHAIALAVLLASPLATAQHSRTCCCHLQVERLGDNKQDVRQAACDLLLDLLQVSSTVTTNSETCNMHITCSCHTQGAAHQQLTHVPYTFTGLAS